MWIVEKNRKRARMRCASGLFSFAERREGLGQWRFGTAVAPPPISQKPLGRGPGETFLKKGPPPVFTHSLLIQALLDHGVGHLTEAGDVAAEDVVAGHAEFLGGFMGGLEDVGMMFLSLASTSSKVQDCILRFEHFELAGGHAARVGALAGPEGEPGLKEGFHASGVEGMLAPSHTRTQPFLMRLAASAPLTSFCVALGKASLQGTFHTGC